MADGPIHDCIDRWHAHLRGNLDGGLESLLHEDCVFLSPVVFSPQRGRELTTMYLTAAGGTLGGGSSKDAASNDGSSPSGDLSALGEGGAFGYTKHILQGHHAMLEFETTMYDADAGRDCLVNGVDIITCDDDGMIVEFKVMIRPLQAINLVHAQMKAALESMTS